MIFVRSWLFISDTITFSRPWQNMYFSWFQIFAVFWMLYASFWVIPRHLNFVGQRFRTLCLFHLHRQVGLCRWNRVFWNVGIQIQTLGGFPEESIQQNMYSFSCEIINKWHDSKNQYSVLQKLGVKRGSKTTETNSGNVVKW